MSAAYLRGPANPPLPEGSQSMTRACDRLTAYESAIEAAKQARLHRARPVVYRCDDCRAFHLGRARVRVTA